MYPGAFLDAHPDKPALIWAATGEITTYAELDAAANRISRMLRAAGVEPGDHVAICMENHPRYLETVWGCHYAGAIYTAVSSRLTSAELTYIINDCAATVFITSKYQADQAAEILIGTPNVTSRYMLDGTIDGHASYEDAVASQNATPLENRVSGTDMLYSSGTTGQPKGVALKFEGGPLESAPPMVTYMLQLLFGVTEDDVYLSPAPTYHAAPLRFTMAINALGATAVVMDRFEPEAYLELVERYRITASQVVPHDVRAIAEVERRRSGPLRRVNTSRRHPCGRAMPGAGEGANDRLVRTGDPRVLRRYRGQRARVLQFRAVAGAPGNSRHADCLHNPHLR